MNSPISALSGGQSLPQPLWNRLGFAGFLFFLIKGLLWILAPTVI